MNPHFNLSRVVTYCLLAALAALLSACGQKGPLYLPNKPAVDAPAAQVPAAATTAPPSTSSK